MRMGIIDGLWLIFSYLAGSFPTGYLIARLFGKRILEIGWRKTSGTNVLKNVGKWQGILTIVLDALKGYLVIYGAQKLELGPQIQALSGLAAISGHNWSVFLRFSGGRGIATFFGVLLAFSPQIFLLSLIPFLVLALFWTSAVGTLLSLVTVIILAVNQGQFETAGFFTILVLAPIFIKRLSPIKELLKSPKKEIIIFNRLIFDSDKVVNSKFR